jgi:RNA polymerase primary sigma factor
MAKAIVLQARSQGTGQRLRTAMEDYRAVDERLLGDLGRNPTLAEIAEELHITEEEAEAVRRMLENARMMQKARPQEEEPEETPDDEQAVENTGLFQMRARIAEMLSGLSQQDQTLLTLRFGLEGGLPLSTEEVGRKLGLTPEEVTMREAAALSMLRNK